MGIKTKPIHFSDDQKGRYALAPDVPHQNSLVKWIVSKEYLQFSTEKFRMDRHTRKRNNLYTFEHPILETEVVLKVSKIDNQYKLPRRLNLYVSTLFSDYNLRAFQGAIALKSIDIKCTTPIAYWNESCSLISNKNYYMYEKVHADDSLFSFSEKLASSGNNDLDSIYKLLAEKITKVTRTIHEHGFRQGDPHPGNFLISLPNQNIKNISTEEINKANIYIIDLDKFCKAKPLGKTLKRFFDLRCMRRCTLGPFDQTTMLKFYLKDEFSKIWERVLYFWIKGGFNIFKWFKAPKRGR